MTCPAACRSRVCCLALLCASSACSYDWTPGDATLDGSAADAPGSFDAPLDRAANDGAGPPTDGAMQDASMLDGASPDDGATPGDTGPTCAQMQAQLRALKAAAIACSSGPSACSVETTDECGCQVVVGDGSSTKTASYEQAVTSVKAQCGTSGLDCPGCGPAPMKYLCVVSDAGSGQTACVQ